MNKDVIKGNWKEVKGKLQQKWGKLTNDEIDQMEGSYEELTGKLQKNYGYKQDQAREELDKFIKENQWDDIN